MPCFRSRPWPLPVLATLRQALVLAAAAPLAAHAARAAAPPLDLTLINPKPKGAGGISAIEIGKLTGIFRDEGLNVTLIEGTQSNTPNLVVSGQADVGIWSSATVAELNAKGVAVKAIYGSYGLGMGSVIVAPADVHSLAELTSKAKDTNGGCSIAATPQGSFGYGVAVYINEVKPALHCGSIATYGDPSSGAGAVISGRSIAAVNDATVFTEGVNQHALNVVLNTAEPAQRSYLGPNGTFTNGVWFATEQTLRTKKEAIQRLINGLVKVNALMNKDSDAQLAAIIQSDPDNRTYPLATVTYNFKVSRGFWQPFDGYISEQNWNTGLQAESKWKIIGFDATDPAMAYGKAVDMSFLKNATGSK